MPKASKKQTTQVSTTRRKLLKKLSYSPPLLLCLGSLTRPEVTEATHPVDPGVHIGIYWEENTEAGRAYTAAPGGFLKPLPQETQEFMDWFNAGHFPESASRMVSPRERR